MLPLHMPNRKRCQKTALAIALALTLWPVADAFCASTTPQAAIRKDGRLQFINAQAGLLAVIDVEIADTQTARAKGLMGRRYLDDSMGMLFVYHRPDRHVFWMRNTFISLDIIFVSSDRRVINIAEHTKPMSDTRYRSEGPAQYVVEVPAGFCDRHGIGRGTLVRWNND